MVILSFSVHIFARVAPPSRRSSGRVFRVAQSGCGACFRAHRLSERSGLGACDISPHSFHECKCTPIYLKKERNEAQKLSTNFPPFRCRRSACEALPPRMVGTRKKLPLRAAFFRHATPSILTFFMAFLVSGRADCEFPPPFAAARLCLTAVAVRVLFIKQTK